jgi:bifunctional enzyme CysN/CysC
MATGASTADLALLLVDARLGVLTQTRRHAFIASLLGIRHLVVTVNKMDAVGWSRATFDAIREELESFAARLRFPDLTCIPISALRGDNVVAPSRSMPWYDGATVLQHLESVYVAGDRNYVDLRFPVQLVVRPHQDFRGFAGTVASGVIRVGDEVMALPSEKVSRVTRLVTHDRDVAYAFPPQAVTVCLADELDISRGDLLVRPANRPPLRREPEALLVWMDEAPLVTGRPYWIKHLTSTVKAVVKGVAYRVDPDTLHRVPAETLGLNDIGRVTLECFRPLPADAYDRNRATGSFVMIDPLTHATVAAGMVIERGEGRTVGVAGPVSRDLTPVAGRVTAADRARVLGQQPATVWLTGLSASGKSTVACALEEALIAAGRAACVLDGDNLRHGLCADLGFGPADRTENIRRVAEVARLLNDAGLIVITAFISPYRQDRAQARAVVGEGRFLEVFVDAPLEVCAERDPKGLYRRARAGELAEFTGVTAPYEPPEAPDLRLDTAALPPAAAVEQLLAALRARGCIE